MIKRELLMVACMTLGLFALSCSEETASTTPPSKEKVEPAAGEKKADPGEEDEKKLLALVKELQKADGTGGRPTGERKEKLDGMMKEATAIMSRLTGLDPEAEDFDKKASETLMAVAKKHDPEFHRKLVEEKGKALVVMTQARLRNIQSALEMFYVEMARYPTKEEGLAILARGTDQRPPSLYSEKELMDGWDHPILYEPGEAGAYRIFSVGPDGKEGTEDDVSVPE